MERVDRLGSPWSANALGVLSALRASKLLDAERKEKFALPYYSVLVKAHIGIAGNVAAEKAAKEADDRPSIDLHLGLCERSLKTLLKQKLLQNWQTIWEDTNNDKGRYTYALFPTVFKSRCIDKRFLTQAATNHGLCPFYLRSFNIRACTCRRGVNESDNIRNLDKQSHTFAI
ncbi:hypothetical protein AVEN_43566-1 [Araneus ventricosus]|uniref:RNase H type-1 domain-containing protein n=1 Tax=Araneus ventricosus TaxID=182803 RepID=A0A4Y2ELY7_ARAVE|nr:hypothetical protein AVEN_43566-1 [Araneus ventricosus]